MTYCTLIVRSESEYSVATHTVVTRCLLETPANGKRRGFTDVEALLAALRAELMAGQEGIIPCELKKAKV